MGLPGTVRYSSNSVTAAGAAAITTGVPAHRVVNRNGILTGKHHFGSPTMMEEMLLSEGVAVEGDKIINFNEIFWDPSSISLD